MTKTSSKRDIEHNVNIIYVPLDDPKAFRGAIVDLLDHPDEAVRLGANARRIIEPTMSLDLWVDRISQVAQAVAARAPRRGAQLP